MRGLLITSVALVLLASAGAVSWVGYKRYIQGTPTPIEPEFHEDASTPPPTQDEFETLAKEDPTTLLAKCLSRYQREVRGGLHCTMEKQERVKGLPKHPTMPQTEIIELWVRGDVPDAETKKTNIEVMMKWKNGAKKALGAEIRSSLYSDKADAKYPGKVVPWRPEALLQKEGPPMPPNNSSAQEQSRFCIRDAGLYRSMLRTHEAWRVRKESGELKTEYLGKEKPEKIGRECYVIKRICPRVEIDAFEIGGTASTDPDVVAREGFTEVTIYIDVERWLQVGSKLYRTEPDGTRVLVGEYYFRDVELNPSIPPDTFTLEGLKK